MTDTRTGGAAAAHVVSRARSEGLVLVLGAGVSMVPPTSLPGWMDFNRIVLEAVAERVGRYINPAFSEQALAALISRRDASETFAPDYQAQLIEEECGPEYFSLLVALDTDVRNGCHDAVAALAGAGLVRGIVTTNFDRLCERALDAAGVEHHVFRRSEEFAELRGLLAGAGSDVELPLVKVHGSVERRDSMVDTLQQRVRGLTADLEWSLLQLLERHHVLVLGFSGADLDYNPSYLQLRAAAAESPGLTFLVRSGSPPRPSVVALANEYGPKAAVELGTLPDWLFAVLETAGIELLGAPVVSEHEDDGGRGERLQTVAGRARSWAADLGDMAAINILAALLDGAGDEEQSFRLLRQVWKHYRRSKDCEGPRYGRFCFNVGSRLLDYGELRTEDEIQMLEAARDHDAEAFRRATTAGISPSMMAFSAFQFLGRAESLGHAAGPAARADVRVPGGHLGRARDRRPRAEGGRRLERRSSLDGRCRGLRPDL